MTTRPLLTHTFTGDSWTCTNFWGNEVCVGAGCALEQRTWTYLREFLTS